MTFARRQFLHLAAGAAAVPALSRSAGAQAYPARAITMVVPFAAGGPSDTLGRIVAESMRRSLGQSVIIENVGGAAGIIGTGRVARASPDGYTLVLGYWGTHVANAAIYNLEYDVIADFAPIALLAIGPSLILSKKDLPANDLKGLIAWLKVNPDKALQGTPGVGGPAQIFGTFFQIATGTRFRFVPYRGNGPALQDLVAGHIDLLFDNGSTCLPQVRAGTIKAYAVAAKTRLTAAPEIPTAEEEGLPGFYFSTWFALWAPKGTPKAIIATLNAAAVDALADPTLRARFTELGQEIPARDEQTPEALAAFQKAETEKWWPVIKAAGIKGE